MSEALTLGRKEGAVQEYGDKVSAGRKERKKDIVMSFNRPKWSIKPNKIFTS